MPVKVCDALCGRGKTSSAINMMNSSTEKKYIFITQYLTEVERIQTACASRHFVSPSYNIQTGLTKLADIHDLLRRGENIASTHSLFINYTDETKRLIMEQGYTLVLDEVIDVLRDVRLSDSDIEILKNSGVIAEEDGVITWMDDTYDDIYGRFKEEKRRAQSNNLMRFEGLECSYFWAIPIDLFTSFSDVYILTYMFEAQQLRCFFDLYGVEYSYIGTKNVEETYTFCPVEECSRSMELRDKVHILDHHKLNSIGGKRTALSFSWYCSAKSEKNAPNLLQIKNNLQNLFRNIFHSNARVSMWTTYKNALSVVRGKGYWNEFVSYNQRASNEYAHKKYLAYCVNIFPRPQELKFYESHGVKLDSDMYALSLMVQWLFRSAIRRGEEVWIYIPSRRMRTLLTQWLENLAEGRDLEPINYKTPRKNSFEITGRRRGRPRKE